MDESKTENIYWRFIKYLISVSLSIALLELSGVDAAKANVFSFDKFSFSILILLSICLYTFDNMLKSITKWFNKKSKTVLSN
ncbi:MULTISPECIES: hypothetical protein [Colwellia]|uniref:Uncharacterized protein n=1 Tax=Colwellia marinimaniae TaxID=1513592 RepID=A0ABQ0MXL0_9GAMM|nr:MULTISPECIES: hypothetical protein [Colwellia]GAW97110.1 hypothetical protein MTCD1_02736 [Colwellia marinimaniae]